MHRGYYLPLDYSLGLFLYRVLTFAYIDKKVFPISKTTQSTQIFSFLFIFWFQCLYSSAILVWCMVLSRNLYSFLNRKPNVYYIIHSFCWLLMPSYIYLAWWGMFDSVLLIDTSILWLESSPWKVSTLWKYHFQTGTLILEVQWKTPLKLESVKWIELGSAWVPSVKWPVNSILH